MNRCHFLIAAVVVACAATAAACDDDPSPADPGGATTTSAPTAVSTTMLGKIDRFPGGTAVISSDHALVSIACVNEQLVLTTTAVVFTGTMPCDRMVPPEVIDRFLQKPITITIGEGRLKIESPEAGTLEFPATDVRQ